MPSRRSHGTRGTYGHPDRLAPTMATTTWAQVELAVRALLTEFPLMPATVIAERVAWSGGHFWFAENVARIRPE